MSSADDAGSVANAATGDAGDDDARTCPFCALNCDDLSARALIAAAGGAHGSTDAAADRSGVAGAPEDVADAGADDTAGRVAPGLPCARGLRRFRVAWQSPPPQAVPADAIDEAVRLLAAARAPAVAGLSSDVAGVRAALRVAERVGAVTDQTAFGLRWRNLRTVSEHGAVMTTFAELRNRADLVVLVGDDPLSAWPRAFERLLPAGGALFVDAPRRFIRLGGTLHVPAGAPSGFAFDDAFDGDDAQLADLVALASLRLRHPASRRAPAGITFTPQADRLLEAVRAARYPVFVWDAGRFDAALADVLALRLLRFVEALNGVQRAAALPVGGNDGEATAESVHLWTTGYPSRTRLGGASARYDPEHHDTAAQLARGEIDALVWVSTLDADRLPPPPPRGVALIVVGHPAMRATLAEAGIRPFVFVPVGVPGVHHAGQVFRGDRIVSLHVRAPDDAARTSAADVLNRIADALGATPSPRPSDAPATAAQAAATTPAAAVPEPASC